MTTPGKNQSKHAPNRADGKVMEDEERVPTGNESNELDDDDEGDRIPEESRDDQETGRTDRDSHRSDNRTDRSRGG